MSTIATHLWFNKEAREAAAFYTSIFPGSKITSSRTIDGTPSGAVDIVTLALWDSAFTFISAGPYFKINPSISFLVACTTPEEVDEFWAKLSDGGTALMELGSYPFSSRYGWIQDKYGVSWQVMNMGEMPFTKRITPTLMFVGAVYGKAEEAINFYTSIFPHSAIDHIMRYEKADTKEKEGTIKHAGFMLENTAFAAMDSAYAHEFGFNEAVSFIVNCDDQKEVDHYWEKLSAVPEAEQCGWLKDKFGVSWQIVPRVMEELMASDEKKVVARTTEALLKMKKLDIAELLRAAKG